MSGDDRDYYEARAEQELARARDATDLSAALVHRELAELYLDRVYGSAGEGRIREAACMALAS